MRFDVLVLACLGAALTASIAGGLQQSRRSACATRTVLFNRQGRRRLPISMLAFRDGGPLRVLLGETSADEEKTARANTRTSASGLIAARGRIQQRTVPTVFGYCPSASSRRNSSIWRYCSCTTTMRRDDILRLYYIGLALVRRPAPDRPPPPPRRSASARARRAYRGRRRSAGAAPTLVSALCGSNEPATCLNLADDIRHDKVPSAALTMPAAQPLTPAKRTLPVV